MTEHDLVYRRSIYRDLRGWLTWRATCLKEFVLGRPPSNLEQFAERELRAAGLFDQSSDYGGMIGPAVMKLIKAFSDQNHSGFSAGMCRSLFNKLASFEPIQPLTGEDSEWQEIAEGLFQNLRCGRVFKENGAAYDSEGIVFEEPNGGRYTNRDSRVPILFPYTPRTQIQMVGSKSDGPI